MACCGPNAAYPRLSKEPLGKQIRSIYQDRILQFIHEDGQFTHLNLPAKYYNATVEDDKHIQISSWSAPGETRPKFNDVMKHDFKPCKIGDEFGPSWSTHWFKIKISIPRELLGEERLEWHWDTDGEGLVWTEDGKPLQGLTGGGERIMWIIPDHFRDGHEHTFYIEMACSGMLGVPAKGDMVLPPDPNRFFKLKVARIVAVNLDARGLYFDYSLIAGLCHPLTLVEMPKTNDQSRCLCRLPKGHQELPRCTSDLQCHYGRLHRREG
ncbi:Glycoside hydrolase, 38 vacuolar alpha mannosidase [Ascosphaera atra]|nr:Glycoside hydrolase, 38 vacuolar alpha mannosidase [Ascosphaera atra]